VSAITFGFLADVREESRSLAHLCLEREREREIVLRKWKRSIFVVATNVGKIMCDRSAVTDLGVTRVLPTVDLIDRKMLRAWVQILK
jgi:hypothetical protein